MSVVLDFERPAAEIRTKLDAIEKQYAANPTPELDAQRIDLRRDFANRTQAIYRALSPWQTVQVVSSVTTAPLLADRRASTAGQSCLWDSTAVVKPGNVSNATSGHRILRGTGRLTASLSWLRSSACPS